VTVLPIFPLNGVAGRGITFDAAFSVFGGTRNPVVIRPCCSTTWISRPRTKLVIRVSTRKGGICQRFPILKDRNPHDISECLQNAVCNQIISLPRKSPNSGESIRNSRQPLALSRLATTFASVMRLWKLNSRLVGWSQWVDATLRSDPTCIENKG
jgi:hypothetical protein